MHYFYFIDLAFSFCEDDPNGAVSKVTGSTYSCSEYDHFCSFDWFGEFSEACKKTCGKCPSGNGNLNAIGMNSG